MKKLNVWWLFALLLTLPLGFASCSDDDEGPGSSEELIGTWESTYEKYVYKENGQVVNEGESHDTDSRFRFNADGTVEDGYLSGSQWHWENSGKWSYKGGVLTIVSVEDGEQDVSRAKVVALGDGKLAIEFVDSYTEQGTHYENYEYQEYRKVND